jgi:hypothetical protein
MNDKGEELCRAILGTRCPIHTAPGTCEVLYEPGKGAIGAACFARIAAYADRLSSPAPDSLAADAATGNDGRCKRCNGHRRFTVFGPIGGWQPGDPEPEGRLVDCPDCATPRSLSEAKAQETTMEPYTAMAAIESGVLPRPPVPVPTCAACPPWCGERRGFGDYFLTECRRAGRCLHPAALP